MSDWVIVQHQSGEKVRGQSWPQQYSLNGNNYGSSLSRQNSGDSGRTHSLTLDEQIWLTGDEGDQEEEKHIGQ